MWEDGQFLRHKREEIKSRIRSGRIKILLGTDAAGEGLNLQALGNLINIDLPWNSTRLEQRKGRIQRIGQNHDIINVLNLRYKDSVEDKVHESLSERLRQVNNIFGQVPDVLKDGWVKVVLDKMEEAEKLNKWFKDWVKTQKANQIRLSNHFNPTFEQLSIFSGTPLSHRKKPVYLPLE
ncbi:MAG: helicase-related protein [Sediminispirochaetaceae bacterium]